MQVGLFEQLTSKRYRGVVGVGQERVFDDDTCTPVYFQAFDEVLEEQVRRLG